jgi:hypothetical protein
MFKAAGLKYRAYRRWHHLCSRLSVGIIGNALTMLIIILGTIGAETCEELKV